MEQAEREQLEGVPEPGQTILGKYRVERVLGVGGMGCVVAARHLTLDQHVAIKFLLSSAAKNPKNLQRFQREAQAAARIKSDHVAKVSDIGTLDDGTPYMVMEYLDGEDLSDRLLRVGRLAVQEAVTFLLEACEALAEAHQCGIVHRDLKPANLYLARQPDGSERLKVLDFGISKVISGEGQDLTRTSALMGSPLYMSPEQMMSAKAADHRADIWALGCILFESLTGQPPFVGETLPEICSKILTLPPTPLGPLAPHVPHELAAIIDVCLTKKPEERFQNLGALAVAMAMFAGPPGQRSASRVCSVLGLTDADVAGMRPSSLPAWNAPPGLTTSQPARTGSSSNDQPHPYRPVFSSHPDGPGHPPGFTTSNPATSNPGGGHAVSTQPMAPALPAGAASTAAPVAQTMSDRPRRRSRAPLFVALGLGVALMSAGGMYFGLGATRSDPQPGRADVESTRAAATPEPQPEAIEPEAIEPEEKEPLIEAKADPEEPVEPKIAPTPKAPPKPTAPTPPPQPPAVPLPRPPPVVAPPPKPPPPPPGHQVKPGDDLFN